MKSRILTFLITVAIMLSLVACSRNLQEEGKNEIPDTEINTMVDNDSAEVPDDAEAKDVNIAVTDFAVRLFQTEANTVFYSSGGGANRLISPLSVLTAMAMAANGAEGETLEQIEAALGLTIKELNLFISNYMNHLSQEDGNKFYMANSVWFKEDACFQVQKDFLKANEAFYDADILESPFNKETVNQINHWVEENTDGLIKEILNEIPADAVMYLINALIFDAKWEETYEVSDIREGVFTVLEGIEQNVDFMCSDEKLYLEDEQAIGFIKYYEGRDYAFAALLPKEGISLDEYMNRMSGESLYTLLANPEEVKVQVWIPQFKVEYNVELSDVLTEMGIKDLFDSDRADLSGLGTSGYGNIWVDRVLHKTYMEVSPVGTKAGAATVVGIRSECAEISPLNVKEVHLDRPFLYMIIDCQNNQPIFMGTVNYIKPYRCGVTDDLCSYPLAE